MDYYYENGHVVFTAEFLRARGYCCGNGCRHCPYNPKHERTIQTHLQEVPKRKPIVRGGPEHREDAGEDLV